MELNTMIDFQKVVIPVKEISVSVISIKFNSTASVCLVIDMLLHVISNKTSKILELLSIKNLAV